MELKKAKVEKVEIYVPFELDKITCPYCEIEFAVIGISISEDEWGENHSGYRHQVPNDAYCFYCGKHIDNRKFKNENKNKNRI